MYTLLQSRYTLQVVVVRSYYLLFSFIVHNGINYLQLGSLLDVYTYLNSVLDWVAYPKKMTLLKSQKVLVVAIYVLSM